MRRAAGIAVAVSAVLAAAFVWLFAEPDPHAAPTPAPGDPASRARSPAPIRNPATSSGSASTPSTLPAAPPREIDVDALAAALDSEDEAARIDAIENRFAELVRRDPARARRFVEAVSNASQRMKLLQVLAVGLAKHDRTSALAWAGALQDADERDAAVGLVLTEISMMDPAAAVRLRQESPISADDPVLANLAQRWAEKDLAAALEWADSLPAGEQRDAVTARAAYIQAQTSAEAAARLILDRMSSGPAREEALISVLHQWAQRDFSAAQRWIEDLPAGPMKVRATIELSAVAQAKPGSIRQ